MKRSLPIIVGVCALALATTTTAVVAGPAPPTPRFRPQANDAIDLFNGSVVDLYNGVNHGPCPVAAVGQHHAALAVVERGQARLGNAADAAAFADWTKQMRAFLEAHRGVPGIGDWAAVDAAIASVRGRAPFAMPDDLTTDAALAAVIDRAVTARADADRLATITGHVATNLYNCDDRGAGELLPALNTEVGALEVAVFKVAERLTYDRFQPLLGDVGRLAELDTATWDGHARWVRTAIDVVAASRAVVAMEPRLVALEAFTDRNRKQARDERTRPTTVVALAKQQLVVLPPLIAQRLPEVGFPKVPAKDKARDKVIKSFLGRGETIAFGPRYYAKDATQSYDETDPVDHLRHAVVRVVGNGYVAVKPATWSRALPEGVAADELCELRWFNFFKYAKAGPSHKTKVWLVNLEAGDHVYVGPILCKHAKRVSALPL